MARRPAETTVLATSYGTVIDGQQRLHSNLGKHGGTFYALLLSQPGFAKRVSGILIEMTVEEM